MGRVHSEKISTGLFILTDDQSPPFQPRSNKSILHISCPAVRRADALGLTNDGWKRRESLSSLCARLVYLAEQNWLPDSKNHPICFCQRRSETLFVFRTISGNLESGAFFKCLFFSLSFQQISQFEFKFRENVVFFLSNCASAFFFIFKKNSL